MYPNILVNICTDIKVFENKFNRVDISGANSLIKQFSNVYLKQEYQLVTYLCQERLGTLGYTYALPKESEVIPPKKYKIRMDEFLDISRHYNALGSFMEALDGDNSPLSYLQAAILYHDINEYGAQWHGVGWGRDVILPIYCDDDGEDLKYEWIMEYEEPDTINPHFYYDEDHNPVIVFYTINDIGTITLNQYIHVFSKENYTLKAERKVIGTAGTGIIF